MDELLPCVVCKKKVPLSNLDENLFCITCVGKFSEKERIGYDKHVKTVSWKSQHIRNTEHEKKQSPHLYKED